MCKAVAQSLDSDLNQPCTRTRAVQWLRDRQQPLEASHLGSAETERLLEELRIYQAELEAQNEELRHLQARSDRLLERFSMLFRDAPVCMFLVNRYGLILDTNEHTQKRFPLRGLLLRHHLLFPLVAPSYRYSVEAALMRADIDGGDMQPVVLAEVEMQEASGEVLIGEFCIMRLPRGGPADQTEFLCVFADRTALANLSRELLSQNAQLRLYAQVFDRISEAIMVTDLSGTIVSINPAFSDITGFTVQAAVGKNARMLASGNTSAQTYRSLWASLASHGRWEGEMSNRRADGEVYPEWISISTLHDERGQPWRYVAIFHDLSEARAQEEALRRLAQEDALTGLPNRHMMPTLMNQAFERARRAGTKVGIFFVDLDNFKDINDSLGHLIGDETLKQVAQGMRHRLRDTDTLVRLGGDEFLIIAEHLHSANDASQLAQSLLNTLSAPMLLASGQQLFVSCSLGISLFPDDSDQVEQLLQQADTAMYRAKSSGRSRFEYFSPSLMQQVQEEFSLGADLRLALQRGELFVEYQPIIPLVAGHPITIEALVRWRHPSRGLLPPDSFINIAARCGLTTDLTQSVLQSSCRGMRRLLDLKAPIASVAVNVSFRDLESTDLAGQLEQQMARYGLEGHQIQLELTESDIMLHVEQSLQALHRIRCLGVRIAVDDFGTGFSSLAYLHQLPLDALKIDRCFVQKMETDAGARSITEAIVGLGKALRLRLVAEGVETGSQLEQIRALGVDGAQGWYFSKAVAETELPAILAGLVSDQRMALD